MSIQSINIELERSSQVYYAGEVVRGTVRLVTTGVVKCRGFHLKLVGKSRVHWHTGSGDNRHDYGGTTIFQEQRQVLYGNFFKTGLMDEAGSHADFDSIQNLGIITIPTNNTSTSNMTLIVRVMDYDWGKRDDLLGEIQVNASALAQSGQKQCFPLTRRGKTSTGEIWLSAKILPNEAIFPLKSASGIAVSQGVSKKYCLVLRVHEATGLRKADIIGKNDVYVQAYEPTEPIRPGKALPSPEKTTILPEHETIFPFACQLRNDGPGSAELGVSDYAYVRYSIRAYADFANWRDPCTKRHITVLPNRPLPTPKLLRPYASESNDQHIHTCCCGCRCCQVTGLISLRLQTDRLAYAPGEPIDLTGSQITNDSNRELMAWVRLRCHIDMRNGRGNFHTQRNIDYDLCRIPVAPNSVFRIEELDGLNIPAVYPSFYGGVPGRPTRALYPCLKWTYTLDLKVGFENGNCTGSIKVRSPLLISSAAPYAAAIENAASSSSSSNELDENFFLIFQHAVVGPEACDTGPTVTGPEDGGTITNADGLSPTALYDPYDPEDKGLLNGDDDYQSVVNTFDGPFANALGPPPGGTSYGNDTNDTTPGPNKDVALKNLLKEMDRSFDMRRTVGEWAKHHPREAQRLTPYDFEIILGKVSFSLDQPAVVGELLSMTARVDSSQQENSKSLSCAHVVAAMKVCKYQKVEVAQIMAPHVKDPENKELVLNEIDFEYERNMVNFTSHTYDFA